MAVEQQVLPGELACHVFAIILPLGASPHVKIAP